MTDRSNERSKRKAEYDKEYQKRKRPAINEYRKEYMRLYRARKKNETRFNQMIVAIVDVLTSFDVSTSTIATFKE